MIRPCPFTGIAPVIHESCYVDASAQVLGQVTIGARSSIWLNAVVRGDVHTIEIGQECNVQDLACLHVLRDRFPLVLEERVSVGHSAKLHGCRIGRSTLVGIGATVLDGAEVGEECLVGAGALVTPGTKVPPRSLVIGSPAVVKRPLNERELELVRTTWSNYVGYQQRFTAAFGRGF